MSWRRNRGKGRSYNGPEGKPTETPHNCGENVSVTFTDYGTYIDHSGPPKVWFSCRDLGGPTDLAISNREVWRNEFGEGEDSWWFEHTSGDVYIRTLAYRNVTAVREFIDGLADYPIADESDYSELQSEHETEEWSDWGRGEFRRAIAKHLSALRPECEAQIEALDETLADAALDGLWWDWMSNNGPCEWEEDYDGSHAVWSFKDFFKSWDGLVPELDSDGKVQYVTGDIIAWRAIIDTMPKCPRCTCQTSYPEDGITNVFHVPCANPLCDISPERRLDVALGVDSLARSALIELRTGQECASCDVLADYCEERGFTGLAERLRAKYYNTDYSLAVRTKAAKDILAG